MQECVFDILFALCTRAILLFCRSPNDSLLAIEILQHRAGRKRLFLVGRTKTLDSPVAYSDFVIALHYLVVFVCRRNSRHQLHDSRRPKGRSRVKELVGSNGCCRIPFIRIPQSDQDCRSATVHAVQAGHSIHQQSHCAQRVKLKR